MVTCHTCHRVYPGGERGGHCTACHESFSSDVMFDRHRVGKWDQRRCLSTTEMEDKGFLLRGSVWGASGTYSRMGYAARTDELVGGEV